MAQVAYELTKTDELRLRKRMNAAITASGERFCWPWRGNLKHRYPEIGLQRNTKKYSANRLAWYFYHGSWPSSNVRKRCGHSGCMNPRHFALASNLYFKEEIALRFWDKVQKGSQNECWQWTGYIHKSKKHGIFSYRKSKAKSISAHRLAWALEYGYMPKKLMRDCDNLSCVNPAHLRDKVKPATIRRRKYPQYKD